MQPSAVVAAAAALLCISAAPSSSAPVQQQDGGTSAVYVMGKPGHLASLVANAATIPVNRIYLAFASPTMTYVPGSSTLNGTGLSGFSASPGADAGFAELKAMVATLAAAGVETFISMGRFLPSRVGEGGPAPS